MCFHLNDFSTVLLQTGTRKLQIVLWGFVNLIRKHHFAVDIGRFNQNTIYTLRYIYIYIHTKCTHPSSVCSNGKIMELRPYFYFKMRIINYRMHIHEIISVCSSMQVLRNAQSLI